MKCKTVVSVILLTVFLCLPPSISARELWLSIGSGVGLLPGPFSTVSPLNIDGTVGIGIHKLFGTPLRTDVEITYAGYIGAADSSAWLAGMHGIQGVLLVSYHGQLGRVFILTPRAGIGLQLLFTSSAETYEDYMNGTYTNRVGSQLLVKGGLAADFLLSDVWTLGIEGDYRMLAETGGIHHGAVIKIVLNRKIADFRKKQNTPEPVKPDLEPIQRSEPADAAPSIDLSSVEGVENVQAVQAENQVTFILHNSFAPDQFELTEEAHQQLMHVGHVLENLSIKTISFYGYVAETREDESELDETLSLARAVAVRDWLVAQGYLQDPGKSVVEGRGAENPIGDNSTPEGRALNRRVEILIDVH